VEALPLLHHCHQPLQRRRQRKQLLSARNMQRPNQQGCRHHRAKHQQQAQLTALWHLASSKWLHQQPSLQPQQQQQAKGQAKLLLLLPFLLLLPLLSSPRV
jgi:hypothetical protein